MRGVLRLPNLIQALYKSAVQPFLFGFKAESAHNWAVKRMKQLESVPLAMDLIQAQFLVKDPRLEVTLRTLTCPNPVGMAAGFDKSGELVNIFPCFGFGFSEIGTFTPLVQEGQKKPRMFRYKKEKALINRMGFNNPGVKAVSERLQKNKKSSIPLGINIGKGRDTPLEEAVEDYVTGFEHLAPYADYIVVNVSSPNTPGLRDLQTADHLKIILSKLTEKNKLLAESTGDALKPIFTKVSPDLHEDTIDAIAHIGMDLGVGFIATNTTIDHSLLKSKSTETGGLSGRPLRQKSNAVLKRLHQLTKGIVPLIGVGGIFTAEDAYEKIRLGASLVQVYSGWVYEGPGLIPKINKGLIRLMERDGFKKIQDAIGTL